MMLNGDKFEYLRIGKNLNIPEYKYIDPAGNSIEEMKSIKDLGVIVANTLTWREQTETVVAKARVMVGWALRTFATRDIEPMLTIWNSLIRPILDYCSPLWSPGPSSFREIDILEKTQRNFTRYINGMENLDYGQRWEALKLYSIQRRHERYKIIYAY